LKKKLTFLLLSSVVFSGCASNDHPERKSENSTKLNLNAQKQIPVVNEDEVDIMENDVKSTSSHDFRNVDWGMSRDEVKDAETSVFEKENEITLTYRTEIDGIKSSIVYKFSPKDQLISSYYYFFLNDVSEYINEFKEIKQDLTNKYGESTDETEWISEKRGNDDESWTKGLNNKEVSINYSWDTDSASVALILLNSTFKNEIVMYIEYDGKKFKDTVPTTKDDL
jgi:hypothetical protein